MSCYPFSDSLPGVKGRPEYFPGRVLSSKPLLRSISPDDSSIQIENFNNHHKSIRSEREREDLLISNLVHQGHRKQRDGQPRGEATRHSTHFIQVTGKPIASMILNFKGRCAESKAFISVCVQGTPWRIILHEHDTFSIIFLPSTKGR